MPQKKNIVRKVVIDAGHGGHDPGSVGKRAKEKDIALSIALKLGKMITTQYPEVEVIYTRKTDVFVELYRRTRIANENKADLFISIHCNGTHSAAAYGVETWVMGLHKSKENLEVAKKENASILMEESSSQYDGFDPNSSEANIIFSLYQNVYLDQSLDLATRVQKHFRKSLGLLDRGVKQAGFLVLYKTTMPGILVEAGFMTNPKDEEFLISDNGQDQLSRSIFTAFREYKGDLDNVVSQQVPGNPGTGEEKDKKKVGAPDLSYRQQENSPAKSAEEGKKETQPAPAKQDHSLVYKVQIYSSPYKIPDDSQIFSGLTEVEVYKHQKSYKYTVGQYNKLEDALNLQSEMQKKGFKGAFVVAFFDGERIPMEAARQKQVN